MTENEASRWLERIYLLTMILGAIGLLFCLALLGWRASLAFGVGVGISFGNLWVFEHLSRVIAPGAVPRKPWTGGVYAIRYILLLGIGYATVKFLGIDPLPVILGLFTSAAAVLAYLIFELTASVFRSRRTR